MPIKPDRLIGDLRALAEIGKYQTGVHRPAFSAEDIAAREWLRDKMVEAGLAAETDGVGTVYGRMTSSEKAVIVGSHSDTVPYGGWLDGALGVIYGLEVARCIAESGASKLGVDVVSFQDEEGSYLGLMGSRLFGGEDVSKEMAAAVGRDGKSLQSAIDETGLGGRPLARLDPARHVGFLEAHIEQGPRLESSGTKIGVVSAIVGIKTLRVTFHGEANHAGTTPMDMRHDAGAAALTFGADIQGKLRAIAGPDSVWNVGSARFAPGAANVVPEEAELTVQMRDTSADILAKLEQAVREAAPAAAAHYQVTVDIVTTMETAPSAMSPELAGLITRAAGELGISHVTLPSGAGHDAMIMARHLPSAMLFVPSIGGRSHHVSEDTSEADIVMGAKVTLRAVELLIEAHG
jgi:beta-ureidopropionase / N-carbamoyl-L-amino-acid hydrolase